MNLFDFQTYKVLLDYGHNPESARAMAKLLPRLSPGRKIGLCHGTGSRTDEQLIELGKALALVYDHIILTDFDPRHRPAGETQDLVHEGLIQGGFPENRIEIVPEPDKAVDYIFSKAQPGDLLVIQPDELDPVMGQIMTRYRQMVTHL
jgi:cyanophycin synthetase